jgi:hypothetical protein
MNLPTLVTTKEAAILLKMGPAGVRARVGQGELQPVAQTATSEHLFLLEDVMEQPISRRLGDRDARTV